MERIPQKEDLRFVRGDDVRVVVLDGSGTAKIALADGVAAGGIYLGRLRRLRGGRGNGRVFRADQLNRQSDGL